MTDSAEQTIAKLRAEGKLSALPIGPVDWNDMTVKSFDGRAFRSYGSDGTWVEAKALKDGDIRYLGSASHAGKIEFKALYVLIGGNWHNIINGQVSPMEETPAVFER